MSLNELESACETCARLARLEHSRAQKMLNDDAETVDESTLKRPRKVYVMTEAHKQKIRDGVQNAAKKRRNESRQETTQELSTTFQKAVDGALQKNLVQASRILKRDITSPRQLTDEDVALIERRKKIKNIMVPARKWEGY